MDTLAVRLALRWPNNPEKVKERLKISEGELFYRHLCDYQIVSDDLDRTQKKLEEVLCLR